MKEKPLFKRESFWLILLMIAGSAAAILLENADVIGLSTTAVTILGLVVTICTRLTNKTSQDKVRMKDSAAHD